MTQLTMFIKGKKIVIFGFGAQGRAQALNLKESGLAPLVCLPVGSKSIREAKKLGFRVTTGAKKAARTADITLFLTPDSTHKYLYDTIKDDLRGGSSLVFAHGFSIHYGKIEPRRDINVILVAPLAHGETVRKMYASRTALPVLIAVQNDAAKDAWKIARSYAEAIGSSGEKIIETTFKEETETDLFAEQTLICGGIWGLVTAAFDTLVEMGYSPKVAYYCCLKEAGIMSDLFAKWGFHKTFEKISATARFGALSRGPRIIGKRVKKEMKKALEEIRDGSFSKELSCEKLGEEIQKRMIEIADHKIEKIHEELSTGFPPSRE